MSSEHPFWHARYQQQAGWTLATHRYLFYNLGISPQERLLEVGCGSGAVLETLALDGFSQLVGVDRDLNTLTNTPISHPYASADGLELPFASASFAHCLCHFFLLWVADPLSALHEMLRVTQPGGWVLALAEPDYGGRLSYPDSLLRLGNLQKRALVRQGADVLMGRRLISLFTESGLEQVTIGIIPAQCDGSGQADPFLQDRSILESDLARIIEQDEIEWLISQAEESVSHDGTLWFVPIFYAFGRVPREEKK